MNPFYIAGGISLLLNLVLGGLYLDKRDDLAQEIEACNTRAMTSIAEAESITRKAVEASLATQIADMASIAAAEMKARQIAEDAREIAESRPPKIRTIIKRIIDEDACLATPVHPTLLECLRTDKSCGEARPSGNTPH